MENLVLSFTVVFPLFVQLVLGYGLKRIKLLDDHTLGVCNKLVFRVFLPRYSTPGCWPGRQPPSS